MDLNIMQIAGAVGMFLVIYLSGKQLNKAGTPYGWGLLNLHKLISLVGVVILGGMIFQTHGVMPLIGLTWAVVIITAFLALLAVVTGGLLSTESPPPGFLMLHKVLPYLNALSVAAVLYLLLMG